MKQHREVTSIRSLKEFHRVFGLPELRHPLISLVKLAGVRQEDQGLKSFILDFYQIAYKHEVSGQVRYGQHYYDFGEGGLVFTAPQQRFDTPEHKPEHDHLLLIHPDLLLGYPLASTIRSSIRSRSASCLSKKRSSPPTAFRQSFN